MKPLVLLFLLLRDKVCQMLVCSYSLNAFRLSKVASGVLTQYCFTVEFPDELSMRAFIRQQPDYLRFEVTVREFSVTECGSHFVNAFSWCEQEGYPLSSVGRRMSKASPTEGNCKGGALL